MQQQQHQHQDFDALRREATKLERHLEDKVAKYQQLAQSIGTTRSTATTSSSSTADSSLNAMEQGSNNIIVISHEEVMLQKDISRTLRALSDLISQSLGPASEKSGKSQHLLLVKRYREILFDLTTDYEKTSAQLQRKRQRQELLQQGSSMNNASANSNNNGDDMEQLLMRESNSIQNSMTASQSIIAQASDTYQELKQQGMSMQGVTGTMSRLSKSAIPSMNRMVESIRRKRSRDDVIVALVIAICILLTLWYMFG